RRTLAAVLLKTFGESSGPARRPAVGESGGASGTILVAEDNKVNQRVTTLMLKKLGYDAKVVENGRQALNALASGSFAAVLMDCQMPELDGVTATRMYRQQECGVRIPIVALTANALIGGAK